HLSGFFDRCRCYDPVSPESSVDSIEECMAIAAAIKPLIIRFPTGGENKFVHLLDGPGYGFKEVDIDSAVARELLPPGGGGWYTTLDAQEDNNPDDAKYIDRLIDFVQYCDSVNGFAPKVIFVANIALQAIFPDIYTDVTTENLAAIRYLMDNGIEIAGIEMGNEHYDDGNNIDTFSSFVGYWNICKPLLDSLDADPELDDIKVSLVAAPEPDFAEAFGWSAGSVAEFQDWNSLLRNRAFNPAASAKFDAFSVHIYNTYKTMQPCYEMYTEDYYEGEPDFEIFYEGPFVSETLNDIWECARDSMERFTNYWTKKIFNRYDDACSYCLGTTKEYWVTEWGVKPATSSGNGSEGGSTSLHGNFNNTFIDAGYTLQFLLSLTDIDASPTGAQITMTTRHTELAGFNYGLFSYRNKLDPDVSTQKYFKRAAYYPYFLMQDIYLDDYERVMTTVSLLDGTYKPFVKTFLGSLYPGGGGGPFFHMYYYNPTADTLYCERDSITADLSDIDYGDENPIWGYGEYSYIQVAQLYSHAGTNQYMIDNTFYDDEEVESLIDTIYSGSLPNESKLVILPYSLGDFLWRVIPEPYRLAGQIETETEKLTLGPNPASNHINFYLENTDESNYILEIYSITGSAITILPMNNGYAQLEKNNLASGMYLYNLKAGNKKIGTGKFIFY
ncbi:MAG TPA: T9SS type A sorting domain-containing protein, partial [Chitinophagales bacterium]|nr:T9SS type A sorting domain-containing protein [Chitinophagales bacterium]